MTNYHKPSHIKQQKFLLLQFCRSDSIGQNLFPCSCTLSTEINSLQLWDWFPQLSAKGSSSCLRPHIPWLVETIFFHMQSQWQWWFLLMLQISFACSSLYLSRWLLSVSFTLQSPCSHTGSIQMIQDHFSVLRSTTSILSAKFLRFFIRDWDMHITGES